MASPISITMPPTIAAEEKRNAAPNLSRYSGRKKMLWTPNCMRNYSKTLKNKIVFCVEQGWI